MQGRGCFSISPHFGAQAIPPVRGVLRMLPSLFPLLLAPGQGRTGTASPALPRARLGRGGEDRLPGTIKDAGHHTEGKGSTKKCQRLWAALQHTPRRPPPSPLRGDKGTPEGWGGAGGILWWSKPQTPQSSPGESQWEPIPRTTPRAPSIVMGWEEPGHSTRGTQREEPREHSHTTALPACLA